MLTNTDPEFSTDAILREEAEAIRAASLADATGRELYKALNRLDRSALCLSGGGIRSASFALGVMQALAVHSRSDGARRAVGAEDSLLGEFHYLSTVSGGGYIGGWLSALISRDGFARAWQVLTERPAGPDDEPSELAWLRANSNYLTPKLGITSADSWAAVAIVLRNLVLNWLVILPVLVGVLIVLKALSTLMAELAVLPPGFLLPSLLAGALGIVLLVTSLSHITRSRPTRKTDNCGQRTFLLKDLLPAVLSTFLLASALATPWAYAKVQGLSPLASAAAFAAAGFVIYGTSWIVARPRAREGRDLGAWALSGLAYGALVGIGVRFYAGIFGSEVPLFKLPAVFLLACGVPWLLTAQLVAEMIFVGLTSYQPDSDSDREWFGRAAGWFLVAAIAWLVVFVVVFIGSQLAFDLSRKFEAWIAPIGGASGILTALLGKSRWSPAIGAARTKAELSVNVILAIAAPVFAVTLVMLTSALLDEVMLHGSLLEAAFMQPRNCLDLCVPPQMGTYLAWLAFGLVVTAAIGTTASLNVNINRFSLHALYRNRLIRAYLGASNAARRADANPFTNFAPSDNLRMSALWPQRVAGRDPLRPEAGGRKPFHVINMTLNIASTKRLAWQERKAEPFTVSPLHAGSSCKSYRPSSAYGDPNGISLGTAVAISGAAASPNMGYHSSAPLSFLLAFWNVRLGWWLGNPGPEGRSTYRHEGPNLAIAPFLMEIFGQTTDEWKYVYLSDGGHFENLGLYEMVRRRCRFIVVSDAGEDRAYAFEDLGNAVRKIRIDLGVPIRFHHVEKLKKRPVDGPDIGPDQPYHAVGEIDYAEADGDGEPSGIILYIKPGYHGVEGAGVRSYANAHPEFPHESTVNQWFSESQFESYRALGFEITEGVLRGAASGLGPGEAPTIGNLLRALLRAAQR